jgi:hypothetical protein
MRSYYGCTKDPDHPGATIHRFDMGKRTCRCGRYCVGDPVMRGQAWRQFARRTVAVVVPVEDADSAGRGTFEAEVSVSLEAVDVIETFEAIDDL